MRVTVYHASRIFPSLSISRLPIFPPDKFIPNFKLSHPAKRTKRGIGIFSRDNYPSMISPRTNRRGYGKREREKMMEEKVRKKKRSEQFSAFSSTLLPPLVPLINFVYNRNEGRGWSRNPCTYIYIYIQRCTLGFNQSSKNL